MAQLSPVQVQRNELAHACRSNPNSPKVTDARRNLAAAKIDQYIRRVVSEAPPLTDEQRDRLAALLRGGGANV